MKTKGRTPSMSAGQVRSGTAKNPGGKKAVEKALSNVSRAGSVGGKIGKAVAGPIGGFVGRQIGEAAAASRVGKSGPSKGSPSKGGGKSPAARGGMR
jgi:hypothetical protein